MALRDAARTCITALGNTRDKSVQDEDAVRKQALASMENVHEVAERVVQGSEFDVLWYERHDRFGASLRVAPLSVSGLLREKLFDDRSVVLTSATLKLGGDFNGVGASLGLAPEGAANNGSSGAGSSADDSSGDGGAGATPEATPQWRGLDAGSPFDYRKQGILYVAGHLAPPGRDGHRGGTCSTSSPSWWARQAAARSDSSPPCGPPRPPPRICADGSTSPSCSRARRRWAS